MTLGVREVEREVVVVSGTFKMKPLDPKKKDRVEVYAVELAAPRTGGGGSGTVPEFIRHLGGFVDGRLLNEAEFDPKATVSWHYNIRTNPDGSSTDWAADHDPTAVLKTVSEQTGLKFKSEKRNVRVMFVEMK